ncbi:unnamed protein product [Phytophthora fragariaefolia]|uniref:Unnamed protein product n=1 Tax=Phytophthora fragariaefolia TaxID=1490495 RepID=A0A9W7CZG4_9STRA|nr:unnamed protein product [Phytophthora fragariaefolia]
MITARIPLPRIDETFNKMYGYIIFSVLDLAQGYHQMRVALKSRQEKLYCHRSKCHFGQNQVQFQGHTVSSQGIVVDSKKTEVIANWSVPMSQKQVQTFLGLAGYYRRSIYNNATIALPFGHIVKKDHTWNGNEEHDITFNKHKSALQSARVLTLPDVSLPLIMPTDASGY